MKNQKSLLLDLQNNLKYYDPYDYPDTIVRWNESTDCCLWSGVECDLGGRVIALDLSDKFIASGIDNSSSLFRLQFLQRLNLADNYIKGEIPSAIGKLSSLTYLNLSEAGFRGQVPIEIS
jgi:Leucine-rich repeat (LRR) protein